MTPNFLDSSYIKNKELKPTLERVKKGEKKVAWIPGARCAYKKYGLDVLQAVCDPSQPLNTLKNPGDLDTLLEQVREKVEGLLDEILAKEPD